MPKNEKVLFAWSGGKDSAMALYELLKNGSYEIAALITTIIEEHDRISMHEVRRLLVDEQARSIGIPLDKVFISKNASDEQYESRMRSLLEKHKARGVTATVFGDVFLEDLRKYREKNLAKIGMKAIFPLWKRDTRELAHAFIHAGFKAVVTCVDSEVLDKRFVGREFDEAFLAELPPTVDPCGENGEFHTFVYNGPLFRREVRHGRGHLILKVGRFWYRDLLPFQ